MLNQTKLDEVCVQATHNESKERMCEEILQRNHPSHFLIIQRGKEKEKGRR